MTALPRFRKSLLWLGWLLYASILILGNAPGWRSDIGTYASGFELHSCAYGALAAIFYGALRARAAERAGFAVLTIAFMGAVDELVQTYFAYRHASFGDWQVDVLAAVSVALACSVVQALRTPRP